MASWASHRNPQPFICNRCAKGRFP